MATTEIGNGCGLSTEAVLASNHKRRHSRLGWNYPRVGERNWRGQDGAIVALAAIAPSIHLEPTAP